MTSADDETFICETPLTWKVLEEDLQKALNTTATFGAARSAKAIGVGAGYVAKIVLATLDWIDGEETHPNEIVLKITSDAKFKELCDNIFKTEGDLGSQAGYIHNTELSFYEMVTNEWKIDPVEYKIPKFYCGCKFGRNDLPFGYFAIEYVPNGVLRHMYHNLDEDAVCEVLTAYAKIQAEASRHPESLKPFETNFMMKFAKDFVKKEIIENGLPTVVELVPEIGPYVSRIMEKIDVLIDPETYEKTTKECYPTLFCHGDFWIGNMIFSQDEHSNFHFMKLIDWQICHVGTPVTDLVRLMFAAVSSETKKKNFSRYMHLYYDTLTEELGEQKPPFTYDELIVAYEKMLPLMNIPFIPMFVPLTKMMFAGLEGEALKSAKEVMFDKIRGVMEEAVECLEKYY